MLSVSSMLTGILQGGVDLQGRSNYSLAFIEAHAYGYKRKICSFFGKFVVEQKVVLLRGLNLGPPPIQGSRSADEANQDG